MSDQLTRMQHRIDLLEQAIDQLMYRLRDIQGQARFRHLPACTFEGFPVLSVSRLMGPDPVQMQKAAYLGVCKRHRVFNGATYTMAFMAKPEEVTNG